MIHHLSNVIEGVRKFLGVGPVAVSEARVIRRDEMRAISEPHEKRIEHARGRRQSVQQQKRRRIFRPSLSVENGQAVYLGRAISDWILHETLPFLALRAGRELKSCENHTDRNSQDLSWNVRHMHYGATSKISSSSTAVPRGRLL